MPPAGYNISESATPAVKDEQNEVVPTNLEEDQDSKCDLSKQNQSVPVALGSICWLNMISNNDQQEKSDHNKNEFKGSDDSDMKARKDISDNMKQNFSRDSDNCCTRGIFKLVGVIRWIIHDFTLRHLVWIKLIFLFQSASMTVLYPYLNLHMKSLGISIQETAIINAMVPILFIFTPPLAGFLADRLGNFRVLLSILTALGGLVALLLLIIPAGRDMSPYPEQLKWGISCGKPNNRARFQKLVLQGFHRDECEVNFGKSGEPVDISFTAGTCGYLCPSRRSEVNNRKPHFFEYKVIWPNRGGGFGISEIVRVVTLDSDESRLYHEPDVVDNNIFFPMNWTFHLSCDRIRPNDCIFSPIRRAPTRAVYSIKVLEANEKEAETSGPMFDVESITPPETGRPVTVPVNCGAMEIVAQVVSTEEAESLTNSPIIERRSDDDQDVDALTSETVDTRFSGCTLHCLVNIPRNQLCNNTETGVTFDPSITFWCYLMVRTILGVLTAASLMMFEGAVMATIQELGGDYGIQRFVGNFGAIVFAPLGGYLIDINSGLRPNFSSAIYIYLALKLSAAAMILFIRLDFRPPGERILQNIGQVIRNVEVVVFLIQMMFAGTFWGFIESFLFWWLDDLKASKFLMGWTVAIGMITSLPFLIFSGPITDLVGHINVIIIGMLAYCIRLVGYSFLVNPIFVYPYEALEGLTMALMMTSAVTYVAKISSPQTIASVMGIMGALFFGIGKGSGALFGGLLMSYQGAPFTFRYFAANAMVCVVVYIFFLCCYVRPKYKAKENRRAKAIKAKHAVVEEGNLVGTVNNGYNKGGDRSDGGKRSPDSVSSLKEEEKSDGMANTGPRSLTGGTRV